MRLTDRLADLTERPMVTGRGPREIDHSEKIRTRRDTDMNQALRKRLAARDESGFTLIELLIVISILGILAGIVVFAVGSAKTDSEAASCDADKKTVSTAAEAYKAKTGNYPATLADMVPNYLKTNPGGTYVPGTGTLSAC